MMTISNHNNNGEKAGMNGSRYREVHSPARSDGVGVALRHAFAANGGTDDFLTLIQELDRKTPL